MKKLNANEKAEIMAHAFKAKHNMLAPFKDQREGLSLQERQHVYGDWLANNWETIKAMLDAFDAVMADE